MARSRKPTAIFFNALRLTSLMRRALHTASTEGKVRMRGATGSPVPRKDPMANLFATESIILTLIKAGALKPGEGYGTYVLGDAFTSESMKEMMEYQAAYEAWKSDCAARRKLAAERKSAKELEQKEAANAGSV